MRPLVPNLTGSGADDGLKANSESWSKGAGKYGACCAEMDIWESNLDATAYTPHPCKVFEQNRCEGTDCGNGEDRYSGMCDKGT